MKRVQITSENIDELYKKVNELIDSYFEWKVRPSSLKRYLSKGSIGMKKFIERNDLNNIDKIEKVILDVVEDRNGMEKDGVITFENFSSFVEEDSRDTDGHNDILYSGGLGESDVEYEKIIADKYRTSLGYIQVVDESKHLYEVQVNNNFFEVIIFSKNDLDIIEYNLSGFVYQHLKNSSIKMKTIGLDIKISDILSSRDDMESKLNLEKDVINVISEILGNDEYQYSGDFRGYYIWFR